MITSLSIYRYKSFHPTDAPPINFEPGTPPKPVFLYGTNGAGKSAIGEVIQGLSGGDENFSHCQMHTSNNATYRVLVYNQRFVDKVIRTAEGVPGIFTIGALDAEAQAEIEGKRAEAEQLEIQLETIKRRIEQSIEAGKKVQEAAIAGAWKAHSDYNKPPFRDLLKGSHGDRKKFFDELDTFALPDDVELDSLDRLQERLADATSTDTAQGKVFADLSGLATIETDPIWAEKIVVSSASRLAPFIEKWGNSDWVGQGRDIPHGDDCPFCQQKLPKGFAEDLAKLLDGDRQARLDQAKLLADRYEAILGQIEVSVAQVFKHTFAQKDESLHQAWELLLARINANSATMKSKVEKPAESYEVEASDIVPMRDAIDAINKRVTEFNARIANRAAEEGRVRTMLWQVMRRERAPVYDAYKAGKAPLVEALTADRAEKASIEKTLEGLSFRIKELSQLQTGVGAAVDKINARLAGLGVKSYSISRKGEGHLYCLSRPGQVEGDMTSLSEGEKTLISFLYFLERLAGSDESDAGPVDLGKTIAVIDDPISSLSHNFVFDIASIIQEELIKPLEGVPRLRQVIVLTHNLFFLHEMLRQTVGPELANQAKRCQLLRVVKSDFTKVVPMKASEMMNDYQALWQVLRDARDSNTPAIMVPNAMRCILEHFFWFTHQEGKFKEALKKVAATDASFTPLARFLDRGSHKDGINITVIDFHHYDLNYYFEKFRAVFDAAGFPEHYTANMGNDQAQDAAPVP
ncbi:wobble nucleotide-excising tRNase [Xanthomonas sp. 3272]|uniref:AAA family ATPase n=1 Tax=Xanthomonas arboricola TaxID=56448 RepID=UPI001431525E|nr:AAA family ATPase [Xanthomonas arboricola]NJC01824.1 wobble nucleotide-excising tRNase [Xanthomonas arboricola]